MFFKRLGFGHKLSLILLLLPSVIEAAEPAILGPDGPKGVRPSKVPRPPSNQLRDWLERRREERLKDENKNGEDDEARDPSPSDPQGTKTKNGLKAERPPPTEASMRWDLQLLLPGVFETGKRTASWSLEPGPAMSFYGRLGDDPAGLWIGARLLALSGSGRIGANTGRFAWTYFGPALAREWLTRKEGAEQDIAESSRHRLAAGWAFVSRQGEKKIEQDAAELATKSISFDGPGLWMEYSYGSAWDVQSEWQLSGGLQMLTNKVLVYGGFGISLWDAP